MTSTHADPDRPPSDKAILYCLHCDHSSPIDGDWDIERTADHVRYSCPDCATLISSRPRSSDGRVSETGTRQCLIGD